jgi:4-amino-4-deoxy-L-arabinose transferase-like glycosyltransferase
MKRKENDLQPKQAFFGHRYAVSLAFLSLLLLFAVVLIKIGKNGYLSVPISKDTLYFLYFTLSVCATGAIAYFESDIFSFGFFRKIIWVFLPSQVFIASGDFQFHWTVFVFANIFCALSTIFLTFYYLHFRSEKKKINPSLTPRQWIAKQGKSFLAFVFLIVFVFLGFASFNIAKFAAVDEALWTFGRIEKYWTALPNHDWEKTLVSDKPGITVSIVSGIALLWEDPGKYAPIKWEGRIFPSPENFRDLNFSFRFPIALFSALSILFFYFFIERFAGKKNALYSIAFIGLSPVLIGMARIINSDSLLWIFTSLSIFSYFAYLRRKAFLFLFWTGLFLGLALLTKYVANILFIYFFALIFLEYIHNKEDYRLISINKYLKNSLKNYFSLSVISLAVFYFFCPAAWVNPSVILDSTIYSQAFRSTSGILLSLLIFLAIDTFIFKNFIISPILSLLSKNRGKKIIVSLFYFIFISSVIFTIVNVYTGMNFGDFESTLQSPKSSGGIGSLFAFFANFYSLIFALSPLALLGIFSGIFLAFFKKSFKQEKYFLFLLFFILLYYTGSVATNVALITRYQIIAFPLALTAAGLGIGALLSAINQTTAYAKMRSYFGVGGFGLIISSLIILTGAFSLLSVHPFYFSYASFLLPREHSLDLKDMGSGSYEATEKLNSLPNAKNIAVWTDKSGLCNFFVGICYTGYNKNNLREANLEYVVISSGRESRTKKRSTSKPTDPLNFGQYYELYEEEDIFWQIKINERDSQYVKIIKIK